MQDINLISRKDHHLILKYLGYMITGLEKLLKLSESICHNLFYYFNNELNSTQKLIVIHGIA